MSGLASCDGGNCIHRPILHNDAALIRRVRKDSLENAERWANDPVMAPAARCAALRAKMCLDRLRGLRLEKLK